MAVQPRPGAGAPVDHRQAVPAEGAKVPRLTGRVGHEQRLEDQPARSG